MTTETTVDFAAAQAAAAAAILRNLPKDVLVDLCKKLFGKIGDSARTPKATYLARLESHDRSLVNAAITELFMEGELELEAEGDDEGDAGDDTPTPAPRQTPQAEKRPPAKPAPAAAGMSKLAEALAELGIGGGQPADLDEDRVREIATECGAMEALLRSNETAATLRNEFAEAVKVAMRDLKLPERVIVLPAGLPKREVGGHTHEAFERVLKLCSIRDNVLMVGPAGCGKTALAAQVAEALGLSFSFVSCTGGMSETQLTGWLLPIGEGGRFEYVRSAFVKAYEEGGVFLLDELDAADENVLLVINSALANGSMSVPQRYDNPVAKRNADFVCIAAANTMGHGADRIYVGRNQLDAATLDRFRTGIVPMDYDSGLEETLCDSEVLTWGRAIRDQIGTHKLRRVMSTRVLLGFGRQKAALKWGRKDWESSYFADWTKDELSKVGR